MDSVRSSLNRELAADLFDLLIETHVKARPLFGDVPACASASFVPALLGSARAAALLSTRVPRWTLLYSEAVRPAFSAAPAPNGTDCGLS